MVMDRRACIRRLALGLLVAPVAAHAQQPSTPPGTPAPRSVVLELQQALGLAIDRLHARDEAGVLRHVSDRYRSGGLTKLAVREQLRAMLTLYDTLRAKVQIDDVRTLGDDTWVYSTGEVSGRVRGLGTWMLVLSWQNEPEVVRREGGVWRLYGDQQ